MRWLRMKRCANKEAVCPISSWWRGEIVTGTAQEILMIHRDNDPLPSFHPEFGRFMLEATPGKPWGIGFKDLLDVERNMRWRLISLSLYPQSTRLRRVLEDR